MGSTSVILGQFSCPDYSILFILHHVDLELCFFRVMKDAVCNFDGEKPIYLDLLVILCKKE